MYLSVTLASVLCVASRDTRLSRPLLRRMWWPLERLALETRMQLGGSLPPHLDPRVAPGQASTPAASGGTSLDAEGPGRRDGAAAWEFSIFPSANTGASGGNGAKYVAPPRRLTGLVLVGAATRLPVVRDYITQVGVPRACSMRKFCTCLSIVHGHAPARAARPRSPR